VALADRFEAECYPAGTTELTPLGQPDEARERRGHSSRHPGRSSKRLRRVLKQPPLVSTDLKPTVFIFFRMF
jgi:hypothetical protein